MAQKPDKEKHIVFMSSGGICAFPQCGAKLVEDPTPEDDAAIVGEVAHIVADSRQGPRGRDTLSDEDRQKHTNLILLCRKHHRIVDLQVNTYSVAVLRQMKLDHEAWVSRQLTKEQRQQPNKLKHEKIQSTLLRITHLPQAVFGAPCGFGPSERDEVKERIVYQPRTSDNDRTNMLPSI